MSRLALVLALAFAWPDGGPLQAPPIPFDPAPAITLPTTAGPLSFGGGEGDGQSYMMLAKSPLTGFSRTLWSASVDALIAGSPEDVHYVFMSYAATPEGVQADLDAMRQKVDAAVAALPEAADREHWAARFHYVTVNPLELGTPMAQLLMAWGSVVATARAEWVEGGEARSLETDLVADNGWAKPLTDTLRAALAWYGTACGDAAPAQDPAGRIALIERGACNFTEKAANAEKHGAAAALLFTNDNPKGVMGGSCNPCPKIPVVMMDRAPGLQLRDLLVAGQAVTVTLSPTQIGAQAMAVDQAGRLREFGTIPFPFQTDTPIDPLTFVALEAVHLHQEHAVDTRLAAEVAAGEVDVVPVFEGVSAADPGWAGVRSTADVVLPDAAAMAAYDTLELDLRMSCDENRKRRCPPWDYLVNLYLCDADRPDRCDLEIGRWITAYSSGGRWVTDVSPLLALLAEGGTRRLAFYTQQPYRIDLSLRLSNRHGGLVPKRAVELLQGGGFARDYNRRYHPLQFEVPHWAEKVEVVAFITGHGWGVDTLDCAEFCNHTHHFAVNGGTEHVKEHPVAGTEQGCLLQVPGGVVPNQAGTWIYGRAGWCPGLDVKPWSFDITAEAHKGRINELTYRGLVGGKDYVAERKAQPDPNGFDANINMRSYLVYYARPEVEAGPVMRPYARIPTTLYLPVGHRGAAP